MNEYLFLGLSGVMAVVYNFGMWHLAETGIFSSERKIDHYMLFIGIVGCLALTTAGFINGGFI